MARYKKYCYDQGKFLSVHFHKQISEGTFENTLSYKNMFAIDGCKLPSNASKDWSGTKAELKRKMKKMETAVKKIVKKHREVDISQADQKIVDNEKQYTQTLKSRIKKIKSFLKDNDDKIGKSGKPIKSNITDSFGSS